jgi:hypothetical protein
MTRSASNILYAVLLFLSLVACINNDKNNKVANAIASNFKVEGHYQYYTTGYSFNCETVKHELDLISATHGGTFLYHVYCTPFSGDSTGSRSSLKPYSMIGKWDYTTDSSLLRLSADNGVVIRIKLLAGKISSILDDYNKELPSQILFRNPS